MKKATILFYYADSDWFQKEILLEQLMDGFPEEMQEKARRYRRSQDAYNYVLGRKMLQKGLLELGFDRNKYLEITYNELQKPELKEVFFNISHSKNVVVCALTKDGPIGVDVELKQPIRFKEFSSYFNEREWRFINEAEEPLDNFLFLWRRKESIIKAKGIGLADLNNFSETIFDEKYMDDSGSYFLREIEFGEEWKAALCTKGLPVQEVTPVAFKIGE